MSLNGNPPTAAGSEITPFPDDLAARLVAAAIAMCGRLFQSLRVYLLNRRQPRDRRRRPNQAARWTLQDTLCECICKFDHFRGETESELRGWLRRAP